MIIKILMTIDTYTNVSMWFGFVYLLNGISTLYASFTAEILFIFQLIDDSHN